MTEGKTSTFTIHHDHCKPREWKPRDILAFADFVETGGMQYAAQLARLGVQLVLSEHHVAKGGTLEEIAWSDGGSFTFDLTDDLADLCEDDVTEVCRIYRGPIEYAVKISIGNEDGDFEGYEFEVHPSLEEAQKYLKDTAMPEETTT
jgi:hypothetical protein